MPDTAQFFDLIDENQNDFIRRVIAYTAMPAISAQNIGIRRVADWLCAHLSGLGFEAELIETKGHPFVFGKYVADPRLPTVLLYGHYDVQPADPLEAWDSPPFEPEVRDGRVWGRGIGDNKGQHFAQILAIETHLKLTGTLPCNVVFCLEGEEEIGSPNIADFVRSNRARFADVDLVITADGPLHPSGDAILVFGVRGVAAFELVAEGATRDAHSGNFGGVLPNPAWDLIHLLSTMKDPEGNITIAGINEVVIPPTAAERAAMERLPMDLAGLKTDMGIAQMEGPAGRPYWDRLMFHPTLTINGIQSGYNGPGSKTVLPNRAVAKCDLRLVEPLTPEYVFDCIAKHCAQFGRGVRFEPTDGMLPSKTPIDSAWAVPITRALTRARGKAPLKYPSLGGSLPEYVWTKILNKPAFVVPYANADEANHAPNENLEVVRFLDGIRCGTLLLEEIGKAQF